MRGIPFAAKASSVSFLAPAKEYSCSLQVLRAWHVLKLHRNCAGQVVDGQVYSPYDTQLSQLPRDATLQAVLEEVEQPESPYLAEPVGDDSCQFVLRQVDLHGTLQAPELLRDGVVQLVPTFFILTRQLPTLCQRMEKLRYAFFILTRHGLRFECSSSCEIQQHCHVHEQRSSSNTGRAPPRHGSCYWSSADDQNDHDRGAADQFHSVSAAG